MEREIAQVFAIKAHAYDISGILTDMVFTDSMDLCVSVRMTKDRAAAFRDQLSAMLEKPPLDPALNPFLNGKKPMKICTHTGCSFQAGVGNIHDSRCPEFRR
jgi:hypothetical protein